MKAIFRPVTAVFAFAFLLSGCGGGGGRSSLAGGSLPGASSSGTGTASITLTIPSATSTSSTTRRTPQTVSSQTQSITVSVNGGAPQIFNVTATTCSSSQNGLTCTLVVGAPFGNDGFLVITYSGANGTGTALNVAAFTLNVSQGGSNAASATAGNLITVNSSADGSGSGFNCTGGTCTLREAVAEASTTAGVYTAIMFQGVSSITVSSPVDIGKSGTQNIILLGPGATVPSSGVGAPTASSGLTISGGNTSGILKVESGSSLSVVGLTLANGNNTVDNLGGAIENDGGALAIINAIFSGNVTGTSGSGGGVYDDGMGSGSSIATSTFTNNISEFGGAYYVESGSAGASFSHCLFTTNTAFYAPDLYGEGGAIDAYANLSVDSSTFTGNVAGSTTVAGTEGDGGAIAIWDNTVSPSVTNSTFGGGSASQGNIAMGPGPNDYGYGGAIENDGSFAMTLSGNTFSYNVAKGGSEAYGGAVADYLGVTSSVNTFTNNTADSTQAASGGEAYGGAVFTDAGTTWSNDTFSSNQALAAGTGAQYAEAFGGAIYDDCCSFAASQTTFSNNTASAGYGCDGGGVYVKDNSSDVITFSNAQFTNNTCSASETSSDTYAYGGGLEVDYAYVSLTNVTMSGNTASAIADGVTFIGAAYGGGFEYYDGSTGGCGNLCSSTRRSLPGSLGQREAAASAQKAKTIAAAQSRRLQDITHRQTVKSRHRSGKHLAAALVVHRASTSVRRPLSLSSTTASSFTNVTFTGNTVNAGPGGTSHGGGADLSGILTFSGVTVTNNTSTVSGTGGYGLGGGLTTGVTSCGGITVVANITGNSATNRGGGIYNNCSITVSGSNISGNKVTGVAYDGDGGGGIWNNATLALTQSTLSGNTVSGSISGKGEAGGGGLFDNGGSPAITNSTFASNTSAQDGGGIEFEFSYAALVNNTVYGNTATGNGGNFYMPGTNSLTFQGNIFAGGNAANGKDVAVENPLASNGYNLIQTAVGLVGGSGSFTPGGGDIIAAGAPLLTQTNFTSNGITMIIFAEQSGSNTIDAISPVSICYAAGITVDQRGKPRGDSGDGKCDIGAYEFP